MDNALTKDYFDPELIAKILTNHFVGYFNN